MLILRPWRGRHGRFLCGGCLDCPNSETCVSGPPEKEEGHPCPSPSRGHKVWLLQMDALAASNAVERAPTKPSPCTAISAWYASGGQVVFLA